MKDSLLAVSVSSPGTGDGSNRCGPDDYFDATNVSNGSTRVGADLRERSFGAPQLRASAH